MKKNFKKLWEKLKYWQKGGIIGLISGLFVALLFIYCSNYTSQEACVLIQLLPPILSPISLIFAIYVGQMLGIGSLNQTIINLIFVVLYPIPYLIVGLIIGLIIGKLKKK